MNPFKLLAVWAITLSVLGGGIWGIVYGVSENARGNYAGTHFNEARMEAVKVMSIRYGGVLASHLRFGKPDVVNTHLNSATIGNGQVRIFHFLGPRGTRYCVPIWSSGSYSAEAHAITKGCKF